MKAGNLFVLCATIVTAGILFWPTIYRYDHDDADLLVRTNRLTGQTAVLVYGQWVEPAKSIPSLPLPSGELDKLTGNAAVANGSFAGKLYNGTKWTVTNFDVLVTVKERKGAVRWSRKLQASVYAKPLDTVSFSIPVTGDEGIASTEWTIEGAMGKRAEEVNGGLWP